MNKNQSLYGLCTILIIISLNFGVYSLSENDFYIDHYADIKTLANGDENYDHYQLNYGNIHFYSSKYDQIYINTNGILTFNTEIPYFVNLPFPLEYPSIAPFYSNVDTTNVQPNTKISYFESNDQTILEKASTTISDAFSDHYDFQATSIFVATWQNVPHYNQNAENFNTYQVAIISSAEQSFVQFLYPEGQINWIQGDIGESGLSDVRAQAGFVSEDGRYFNLKGSGTEYVKHLNQLSNHGNPGSWIFLVGKLDIDENVKSPSTDENNDEELSASEVSCQSEGQYKCHSAAKCVDQDNGGYCCVCNEQYYGNGFVCLKNDGAYRVVGKISGQLTGIGEEFNTQMQSYVLLADGRSYTAVAHLPAEVGYSLQILQIIAGPIGWLFGKPNGNAKNGFQITGGIFNHTTNIYFQKSGKHLTVRQNFLGLNYWDQLSMEIHISGEIPSDLYGKTVKIADITEEYTYVADTRLRSIGERRVVVNGEDLDFTIDQEISFEKCKYSNGINLLSPPAPIYNKISKISSIYNANEGALRIGLVNKLTENQDQNPCTDGTAECGENTICSVVDDNESYDCTCKNGYTPSDLESVIQSCVDIDECASSNVCDENANCFNEPGGYRCVCTSGFVGNGFQCDPYRLTPVVHIPEVPEEPEPYNNNEEEENQEHEAIHEDPTGGVEEHQEYEPEQERRENESQEEQEKSNDPRNSAEEQSPETSSDRYESQSSQPQQPNVPSLAPEHWLCDQCSENADCLRGICVCNDGFTGDGTNCEPTCPEGYIYYGETEGCIPASDLEQQSETSAIGNEENDQDSRDSDLDNEEDEISPFCHQRGCSCSSGYKLIELAMKAPICKRIVGQSQQNQETVYEKLPCDIENNCSPNAECAWIETEYRHKCVCNYGYTGNGYECEENEVSCLIENICDPHASCMYDEQAGKSICICEKGYEGNGKLCNLAPQCRYNEDCGENSVCDNGICICGQGFEYDASYLCVPSGSCGGAYCAENAICQWDNIEKISYCYCPPGFIGDGIQTCKSVPPPCNIRSNCGVHAVCAPNYRNPNVYECICNVGYYGDGFICEPEVNCVNLPSLCHPNAQCVSTTSGLQCICNAGFVGNGSHCAEPPRFESGFLLLSQGVATSRLPFDGRRGRPLTMSQMAIGLDKDCTEGRFYWSDISAKHIMSVKYDGSDRKPFITENIVSPEGIAIDWISRRLYWTDSTKDTIEVASIDNPKLRTVIARKNLVNPRGIAVDPNQGKVFWSDWNRENPKIEWSNLDGTERQILLSAPSVKLPNSLAISSTTGELCFVDAGTKKVECINTYSKMVRTVAANLSYPFGFTVAADHFYWTDWETKKIEVADRDGNRKPGIFSPMFGNHKMYGLAAVTDDCPREYSACQINNGDCPSNQLCLSNPRLSAGRSCKCVEDCSNEIQDY